MKHRILGIVCGAAVAAFAAGIPAHAETLLMKRVREERGMNAPHRGMTMNQVERRFGAPQSRLAAAGGDAPKHPVINRGPWRHPTHRTAAGAGSATRGQMRHHPPVCLG